MKKFLSGIAAGSLFVLGLYYGIWVLFFGGIIAVGTAESAPEAVAGMGAVATSGVVVLLAFASGFWLLSKAGVQTAKEAFYDAKTWRV